MDKVRNGLFRLEFLGVELDHLEFDPALDEVCQRSPDSPFGYVVTPNVDHLLRLHEGDEKVDRLYEQAWMSVCDSRVLTLMARAIGLRLATISGVDLTTALLRRLADTDAVVTIIGSSPESVDAVRSKYPRLQINHYDPPMGFILDEAEVQKTVQFMKEFPARFILLTVGSPQQEKLAYAASQHGGISGVGLCVGNSINFLANPTTRAPMWMRRCALEWLYRLLSEPGRLWRRYLVRGPRVFPLFVKAVLAGQAVRPLSGAQRLPKPY